jgi:predicted DNA-binding protein
MAETKAANLRLESRAYSLLHYLSAVERRSKADIVEEALKDYVSAHPDRIEQYAHEVAQIAGLKIGPRAAATRSRAEIVAAIAKRRRSKDLVGV